MKTLKKWGKPVTSVQVFTPQEYVAGCSESFVIPKEANCGVGIENSRYSVELADIDRWNEEKRCYVKIAGHEGNNLWWYPCAITHDPIPIDDLKNHLYDVTQIYIQEGGVITQLDTTGFYGYMKDGAAHIFYVSDLNSIPDNYKSVTS